MEKITYVVGHRNPDTDSIASAIAYAELKQAIGMKSVVAAMAGEPNPQTRYILERLGIHHPRYLADVHPKVLDIVKPNPVTVSEDEPAYEALEKFHASGVRTLPVIDAEGKPQGALSLLRLSEKYLLRDSDRQREFVTTLASLAITLKATFAAGSPDNEPISLKLFIGAMLEESFSERIDGVDPATLLIMTGNRRTIQLSAIERGVRLLVVTGGHPVDADVLAQAREKSVTLLLTPHDTATAAWLARLSTPVGLIAGKRFSVVSEGETVKNLKKKMLASGESALFVIDGDGVLAAVATKSSLMTPIPHSLILVDHNELAQAVPGAEDLEILEVIDHHKLGNSHTASPITFITSPVGSTCTLVALRYRECRIEPDEKIAALLLAGILSDTVILKSPTTTAIDREIAQWLGEISKMELEQFGREIFAASSSLSLYGSPMKAVEADFKLFSQDGKRFGVGQVEVVGFDEFEEMKGGLLEALAEVKKRENLFIAALMVTDITAESTLLLVEGHTRIAHVMEYPQLEPHLYELKNVMSRKKQMVPHLIKVLGKA